jgi:hypothetical protein
MKELKELEEVWRPIQGFTRYEISSKGRVKSYTSSKYPDGKILKQQKNANGYLIVALSTGDDRASDNKRCIKRLHRLVAEAFIPIPEELKGYPVEALHVDHILPISRGGGILNEDGTFNLRWCTPKGNARNPYTVENQKTATELKRKKKVFQYDENLNLIATYPSTADCSRELKKSQGNIASCCDGALKRYLGYIFSYEELSSMEQREKLEDEKAYQRERNSNSTSKAGKRYYERNADTLREKAKVKASKYYYAHRDSVCEKRKIYYLEHREYFKEKGKQFYQEHKEELKIKHREYYQKNKEKLREEYRRRKEQKNGNLLSEKQRTS